MDVPLVLLDIGTLLIVKMVSHLNCPIRINDFKDTYWKYNTSFLVDAVIVAGNDSVIKRPLTALTRITVRHYTMCMDQVL